MPSRSREDRFLSLVEEHKGILYRVAGAYCREPADREDLAQEIVVQLWRSFDRYDETLRFSTWMYRIALNVAISFSRGESRRRRRVVPAGESLLEVADERAGVELDESPRLLRQVLERLDALERALVILYLDGNRYETIAEVLGISETNVGTKLGRIKQRLRRELAPGT